MNPASFPIKKIYIENSLKNSIIVKNIIENTKGLSIEIEWVENPKEVMKLYSQKNQLFYKDILLVQRHLGKFLSSCPGSDGVVCCQYFVINFGVGCVYDCHYCYLQTFMNQPLITLFGNVDDLLDEVSRKIQNKAFHFRIGTGEYTDSLALDPLIKLSPILIEFFAKQTNATLELKTKSSNVDHLLDLPHNQRTVISWSVNPEFIVNTIEHGTSTIQERLEAALKAQKAGYKLAFHFDPIIYYENWEKDYYELIDHIFDVVNPNRIAWISLGTFRYSPNQKEIMQKRYPEDFLTKQEMVQGKDHKFRYYKEIRYEVYSKIRSYIQKKDPKLFLYLCMETQFMWDKVFGFIPSSSKSLDLLFEERRKYVDQVYQQKV
ncbi:MAG: radical SAM protein [Leptospiraceae bacterium]|nr:radical SAM protein [Leptospiraceae bacterium]MDW7975051.1 radical SAM protein [Leptospiraceae bacterium]